MDSTVVPEERLAFEDRRIAPDAFEQRVAGEILGAPLCVSPPVRREFQRGDARLVRLGKPDPELDAERFRDLLGEEASKAPAVGPPHELAAEPAIGERVIAEGGARVRAWRLRREERRHAPVVAEVGCADRHIDAGKPRGVGDDVADEDLRLAELRPMTAHGIVEADLPTVDEHQDAKRDHALGAGVYELERVLLPRPAAFPVGNAAPEVDHRLAMPHGREGRAQVATLGEIPFESLGPAHSPGQHILPSWIALLEKIPAGNTACRGREFSDW